MLTTADVEQKTFSTALRGYDLDEVDDFLDEVVATIRELTEQLETAQQGRPPTTAAPVTEPAAEPEPEPEAPATVAPAPAVDESAIGRALLAAQNAADQLLAEAQAQAASIVSDAQGEADTLQSEKEARRAEAESEIAALAARVSSIRSELSVLAGEVSVKLDEMDAVITEGGETGYSSDEAEGEVVAIANHLDDEPLDLDTEGLEEDESLDDSSEDSAEQHSADHEGPEHGEDEADELDEILTGVANDLQFGSDDDDEDSDEEHE
jgi:DivIVA domain-containing protein